MTPPASAPLTIEITRGFAIESTHQVHAVLVNGSGRALASYGDAERLTFPRSTLKPLQAIALVESGAADAFALSEEELALACASHTGEERHVAVVERWLSRLGLDASALECGAHPPYSAPSAPATPLHNNCSGKHAGMLTLALFLKAPIAGYTQPDHPVQHLILLTIGKMAGVALPPACCGIDGCSAPNPAMPLEALARGFATFMAGEIPACQRLFKAMTTHPNLVGGTGRLDTVMMQAAGGTLLSKTGAEGTYIALSPAHDTALVLKAEDGSSRAAHAALFALLERHGLAAENVLDAIRSLCLPVLKNWRGLEIGLIRVPYTP
jgi:L-asparaginase II